MDYIYFILISIIFGLEILVLKLQREKSDSQKQAELIEKEKGEYEELGKGLAEYQQKLHEKKERAKQKIVDLIAKNGRVNNREVAEILGVSRATIIRYLDELEQEGKAKQVGKYGQKVFYEAK